MYDSKNERRIDSCKEIHLQPCYFSSVIRWKFDFSRENEKYSATLLMSTVTSPQLFLRYITQLNCTKSLLCTSHFAIIIKKKRSDRARSSWVFKLVLHPFSVVTFYNPKATPFNRESMIKTSKIA